MKRNKIVSNQKMISRMWIKILKKFRKPELICEKRLIL